MRDSSFKHYDLDQANRSTLVVSSLLGVDYSTSKFLVSNYHAIDLKNYIYKDNVVQKRNGVEVLKTIKPYKYIAKSFSTNSAVSSEIDPLDIETYEVRTNGINFNGIWQFKAEDGIVHVVCHIGKLLYEVKNIGAKEISIEPIITEEKKYSGEDGGYYYQVYEFEDYKSSAFVGGNKLWFMGGNKYMCLRFLTDISYPIFEPVDESKDTPIPTTTISITYQNSIVTGRHSLDKVNLLTRWRKNKLISGTTKNEDDNNKVPYYDYTLDAPLICKDINSDMANFSIEIEERGTMQ